ncbi:hypothetical protein [Latilactobacillus sakei]|uniref:hypothetical protein n=1 Tax=Latilactobacillus sakei TaxID=1599 RepID=UPI00207386CC|nr:hypothetical protein [Latilactobacillus sakei]
MTDVVSLDPVEIDLDLNNPRFSMFNFKNEDEIMEYLIKFEQVKNLAVQIAENGYNTIGERIVVLKKLKKENVRYTVIEGNRRVAALKLLFKYQYLLNSAERSKIDAKKLKKESFNVDCDVVTEDGREKALFKISAKHVAGIKDWSATDKRVFYSNLFERYTSSGLSKDMALEKILTVTPEKKTAVKKAIKELKFLLKIHSATKDKFPSLEELTRLDTDVIVSRILRPLTKELKLKEDDEFNLVSSNDKIYINILTLLGESVWITQKLNTRSFNKQNEWKGILQKDQLVSGLKDQIKLYFSEEALLNTPDIEDATQPLESGKTEESSVGIVSKDRLSDKGETEGAGTGPKMEEEPDKEKYKLFVKDDTKIVTIKEFNLSDNIELQDMSGNTVPRNSSEYVNVTIFSSEDGISINNNKIKSISKNGHYLVNVNYKDKTHQFDLILNIPEKRHKLIEKCLVESVWYDDMTAKLSGISQYNEISSILRNLKNFNIITDDEDTYVIICFLIRTLIEYVSKAYWDKFKSEKYADSLPTIVGQLKGDILQKKLINKTEAKSIGKVEDLEKLNGEIHDYKTSISTYDFKSIFSKYKKYITVLINEITQ